MKDNFDLVAELEEMASDEPLAVIPKDTPRDQLFDRLKPILTGLVSEPELTREATFKRLENYFKLSKEEAKALRRDFKALSKSQKEPQENDKDMPTALGQGIIDIVADEGIPAFLTTDGEVVRQLTIEGQTYCPPAREALPFLLPRAEAVLEAIEDDTDGQLYHDIRNYIHAASDLPGDGWYDLLTAWVFHTYLTEKAEFSPYVWFFAVPERGKSRTGKALTYLAYRGLHVESLRDAYLVRVASNLGSSLFFDVADIWKKAERNGTEDILLGRYERGAKVPRVLYPDKGAHRDTVYYSIFGPTLIATNEGVPTALDSRAIQINMQPATRNFENDITPKIALPLKERLVAFRYRHTSTVLPGIEKPSSSRLGDILKPLAQIVRLVQPDREAVFMDLVREVEERRGIDRGETIEAKLVRAIVDLEDEVYQGRLLVKTIVETYNKGIPEKWQVSARSIGKRLVALGFRKMKAGAGSERAVYYDPMLIEKLSCTYLGKTSVTSDMPKVPSDVGLRADVTTDVCNIAQETSGQTSGGRANNHAGYGVTDISDIKTRGAREKKNTHITGGSTMEERCEAGLGCEYYQVTGICRAGEELLRMAEAR